MLTSDELREILEKVELLGEEISKETRAIQMYLQAAQIILGQVKAELLTKTHDGVRDA